MALAHEVLTHRNKDYIDREKACQNMGAACGSMRAKGGRSACILSEAFCLSV